MAAAYLTITIKNASGRRKSISGYASDASAALCRFDESKIATAGSPDNIVAKENGQIIDICFTSDLATPTHVQLLVNGTPTGDILDVTAQLASITARAPIGCNVSAGSKIQLMQL